MATTPSTSSLRAEVEQGLAERSPLNFDLRTGKPTTRKQVLSTPCGKRVARTIPTCGVKEDDDASTERFTALARWQGCTIHGMWQ